MAFQNDIHMPTPRSPARLVRHFFSRLVISRMISSSLTGHVFQELFGGEHGIGGYELPASVGTCGGQPGSRAITCHSLATDMPCMNRVSPGVRRDATRARGGSQPEQRHDLAAEVPWIDRRRIIRYGGFSIEHVRMYPISFTEGAPIHVFDHPLP
jgi:hypothetical protein